MSLSDLALLGSFVSRVCGEMPPPKSHSEGYPPIEFADYLRFSQVVRVRDINRANLAECACDQLLQPSAFAGADLSALLNLNFPADNTCSPNSCTSNMTVNKRKTLYAIHPVDMPPFFPQSAMDHAVSVGNVGLYGHVTPYDQTSSQGAIRKYFFDIRDLFVGGNTAGEKRRFVKIEYWQFFPHNGGHFPHEGDWDTVQLLVDMNSPSLPCQGPQSSFGLVVSVFHYHHGDESRYDFSKCNGSSGTGENGIKEFSAVDGNKLQLFQDADGNLTHPVAYIEYQTHEFWPTSGDSSAGGLNHDGNGPSFLTSTPPNLGEVEAPLSEYLHAAELMRFNGYWGACCSKKIFVPPGPTLHTEWTWPASSSVGWLVFKDAEN